MTSAVVRDYVPSRSRRPRTSEPPVTYTARVSAADWQWLRDVATETGVPMVAVLAGCIRESRASCELDGSFEALR